MPSGPNISSRFGDASQCSTSSTSCVIISVVMCGASLRVSRGNGQFKLLRDASSLVTVLPGGNGQFEPAPASVGRERAGSSGPSSRDDAGHWPHQERVEDFNTLVLDWIANLP
jgi:hypothetical protein